MQQKALLVCSVYVIILKVYRIRYMKGVDKISKLAQVRKEHGLSQERLAELSGVHRVTIARIESGEISPNVRTLEKLSGAMEVPVTELIEKAG